MSGSFLVQNNQRVVVGVSYPVSCKTGRRKIGQQGELSVGDPLVLI